MLAIHYELVLSAHLFAIQEMTIWPIKQQPALVPEKCRERKKSK